MKTVIKQILNFIAIKIGGGINDGSEYFLRSLDQVLKNAIGTESKVSIIVSAQEGVTNQLEWVVDLISDASGMYDAQARDLVREVIIKYEKSQMFKELSKLKDQTNSTSNYQEFAHSYNTLTDRLWEIANGFIAKKKKEEIDRSEVYNAIVPYGELLAENLFYHYIKNFHTDSCVRIKGENIVKMKDGLINIEKTIQNLDKEIKKHPKAKIYLTAGFICSDEQGNLSTLGKEGSDLTCMCIATLLGAKSTILYKRKPKDGDDVLEIELTYDKLWKFMDRTQVSVVSPKIFPFIEKIRMGKVYKIPIIKIVDFYSAKMDVMSTIKF